MPHRPFSHPSAPGVEPHTFCIAWHEWTHIKRTVIAVYLNWRDSQIRFIGLIQIFYRKLLFLNYFLLRLFIDTSVKIMLLVKYYLMLLFVSVKVIVCSSVIYCFLTRTVRLADWLDCTLYCVVFYFQDTKMSVDVNHRHVVKIMPQYWMVLTLLSLVVMVTVKWTVWHQCWTTIWRSNLFVYLLKIYIYQQFPMKTHCL